jgi:3-methyladenine DNA glycosylase AlkD
MLNEILRQKFELLSDTSKKESMQAYMRNQFLFFGLPRPVRNSIQAEIFKNYTIKDQKTLLEEVFKLWAEPEREFQYAALDLMIKHKKLLLSKQGILALEALAADKSWWDTVDILAGNLMGKTLAKLPNEAKIFRESWAKSQNFWLNRCAILYQLHFKTKTDEAWLAEVIEMHKHQKEFFIQKAIGWALRQYAKTNPDWVQRFVDTKTNLPALSKREALKHLK